MTGVKFNFRLFLLAMCAVVGAVGAINILIDPLWYQHGNRLTGKNFSFNERVSKINLLKRTASSENYDCLILGSSRVTALRASQFSGMNCFNLSLKGAKINEIVQFASFARELGIKPRQVFIGVDEFVFIGNKSLEDESGKAKNLQGTPSAFHAWFSLDVLTFSAMTLAGLSPDPDAYYDREFEAAEFPGRKYAKPYFKNKPDLKCGFNALPHYARLGEVFPQASIVGYAPPMTPFYRLSDVYSRKLLDCTAEGFHRVAQNYDRFLDFAIPSEITVANDTSYDGHHFSPAANDRIVAELLGANSGLALDVKALSLSDYQQAIRDRLNRYLKNIGRAEIWEQLSDN